MPYYEYEEKEAKKRKIKINPCKKCKSTDIEIHNFGYMTFNVGTVTCKNCKTEIKVDDIPWSSDGDIALLKKWNYENSKKHIRDQIKVHQKSIKALEKELKRYDKQ